MEIVFDRAKSFRNLLQRQLPFERAIDFDWETARPFEDTRFSYPEKRILATGFLDSRLHILCFTPIENGIRVISFRKANKREIRNYEKRYKEETTAANEPRW
ncbi:MAG: BrnT family toxin [Gammaproteobacteria bacterium]|nr:BrnT family toxin [Gammaproteobacteria bacterium]